MKLKNIFRKADKGNFKTKVQSLDKKQLEKVIGGTADGRSGKGNTSDGLSAQTGTI